MSKLPKLTIALALFIGLSLTNWIEAQQAPSAITIPTDSSRFTLYRNSPVWKDMINDTSANYFEVQKAFELFWSGKEMPEDEDEVIGENRRIKNNLLNRILNTKELRAQQERDALAFDYKRYKRWLIITEPYIQDDGSIMTSQQRLELWKKHYEELNGQK